MHYRAVIALLAFGLPACEPMSGTDKERARRETREMLARNAERGEHERMMRSSTPSSPRASQARYRRAWVCDVCPFWCDMGDLRQVPVSELRRMYREAARQFGDPVNHRMHQLAWLELQRLACIAKAGGSAMKRAWLTLLDAREELSVRYAAAVQAIQHDLAPEPALRALDEIAAGSSKHAVSARIVLDEWSIGIEPSL